MEINKFNQTMKYLTRPAERPAKTLYEVGPLTTPDKELYEVGPLTTPDKELPLTTPDKELYEVGPLAPPDNLPVTTDLPEEGMEFQSVIEGFGESLDRNERQEFDEGGVIGGGMIEGEDLGSRTGFKMVVNVSKLEKLKDLIEESNQRLDKINIKQLYLDAGYSGKGLKKGSEAAQLVKNNLLTNEERIQKQIETWETGGEC